jgi:hypothetical protein
MSSREWTTTEFTIVLENPRVPTDDLAARIDRRPHEIDAIRSGIHLFHRGRDTSMLPQSVLRVLDVQRDRIICAMCSSTF